MKSIRDEELPEPVEEAASLKKDEADAAISAEKGL
jgi:hypothetical protein